MPALPQGWCQGRELVPTMLAVKAWVKSWAHVMSTNIPLTKTSQMAKIQTMGRGRIFFQQWEGPQSNTPMPVFVSIYNSLGRLQKYPKIHVGTGEESSGSGTDSSQGLCPGIEGRGIPRGPRATRMWTGLS